MCSDAKSKRAALFVSNLLLFSQNPLIRELKASLQKLNLKGALSIVKRFFSDTNKAIMTPYHT